MAAFSGGKLADVFGKVTIVNKWPLLLKATSDDEKPIPGYIYPEVSALTYESSNQQQGTAVLSFLLDRLDKKSWNVKVKVLQVMAYVAIHGECTFRNSLRRQTKSIQEATKYNTAPDPLHGNAPILAVRKAATELLEILFNESLLQKSPSTNSCTGKMEGFGSSPINTEQRTVTDTVKNNLQQLSNAITLPASQDKVYRSLQSVSNSRNDHPGIHTWNSPTGEEPGSYQPVQVDTYDATNDSSHRLGPLEEPKKNVVDEGWNREPVFPGSVKTSSSSEGHSGGSLDLSQRLEAVAMADWSQEEQLVIDIVSSSERKTNSVPSREEINSFAKRASTLNSEKIIEILVNKMKVSTDAQVGCLCGIEAIVREGLVTGECALPIIQDVLPSLQRSSNNTVRAKASKIQRQLNLCDYQSTVTTKPNPSSGNTDILVNSDPLESPARKNLFNGMSLKLESQKHVNTVETSLQSPEIVKGVAVPLLVENLNQEPDLIRPVRCLDGSISKLETQHVDLLSFDGSHQNRNINTPNNAEDDLILDSVCSGAVGHLTESIVEPNVRLKASEYSSKKGEISLTPMDDQLSGFLKSFTSNDGSVSDKIPMKQQGNSTVAAAAQQEPSRLLPMNQGSNVNVGELHPQLMGAKMSFQSTVPLQLNNTDDGQFGFISTRSEAASKNSFDFVQEAMKVNRR